MSKPLVICVSTMLGIWALTGCGNKGDLFLPPDAQLTQQMDSVSERIGEGTPAINGTPASLPEEADVNNDKVTNITDEAEDTDQAKPARKP